VVTTPRFSVSFNILYRVIQRLIQNYLLSKMVYLDVKYIIAHEAMNLLMLALVRTIINELLCYSTETTARVG